MFLARSSLEVVQAFFQSAKLEGLISGRFTQWRSLGEIPEEQYLYLSSVAVVRLQWQ